MNVKAVVYPAQEGGYWAKVPSLAGVYMQAATMHGLETNLREAVELYLSDETAAQAEAVGQNGQVLEIAV